MCRSNVRTNPDLHIGQQVHFWRDDIGSCGPAPILALTEYEVTVEHNGRKKTKSWNRIRSIDAMTKNAFEAQTTAGSSHRALSRSDYNEFDEEDLPQWKDSLSIQEVEEGDETVIALGDGCDSSSTVQTAQGHEASESPLNESYHDFNKASTLDVTNNRNVQAISNRELEGLEFRNAMDNDDIRRERTRSKTVAAM